MNCPSCRRANPGDARFCNGCGGPLNALSVPWLARLSPSERTIFEEHLEARHYAKGERVFRKGDPATSLFLIASGRIDVLVGTDSARQPAPASALVGSSIGEIAVLSGRRRSSTAIAAEDSILLEIHSDKLETLMQRMPALTRGLLDYVTERLAHSASLFAAVSRNQPDLGEHASPDGTVTLMFTDMCGSTEILTRLGDLETRRLFKLHDEIVRAELKVHGGFEVEQQGDGFVLAFASARDALLAAIAIQRRLASLNRDSDQSIEVRIGLHTGEVIKDAKKFFGLAVVLASRIAAQARAGEILISSVVRELTQAAGDIRLGPPRTVTLKGSSEPQRVFAVEWTPATS